ncbi:MAG: amidohydrolase family protein, partial [Acidimicrobiales bacterium]|nr:amidohydrolase family protein [Acidimicrobiales bacterium]
MHDLVIRGGSVIDGSGADPVTADVAVDGDRIVAVASDVGPGRRTIEADGLLVTPGWVDIHTHYDGQVTWDDDLTPSSWHGVTTAVMGNCGVGFAPCHPAERQWLVELMEAVEDIPGTALAEGMRWEWETFPEYLDFLSNRRWNMDIGTQVAHGPVRAYVMGERGARNEPATPDDIAAMATLVREAVAAGALGFSTSRTLLHRAIDGEPVPGTFAAEDELFGIGKVLGELGTGLFEVAPAGVAGEDDLAPAREMAWMRRLAATIGRPVTFGMTQSNTAPRLYRELLAEAEAAAAAGSPVVMQVAGRASGLLFGLDTTYHPFKGRPTWDALDGLPVPRKLERLRDPEVRRAVLSEGGDSLSLLATMGDRIWPFTDPVDYEPHIDDSIARVAERQGRAPAEVLYDLQLGQDGNQMFMVPVLNYVDNT